MRFCYLVAKQIIRIMRLDVPLVLTCTEMAKKIRPFKGDRTAAQRKIRWWQDPRGQPTKNLTALRHAGAEP